MLTKCHVPLMHSSTLNIYPGGNTAVTGESFYITSVCIIIYRTHFLYHYFSFLFTILRWLPKGVEIVSQLPNILTYFQHSFPALCIPFINFSFWRSLNLFNNILYDNLYDNLFPQCCHHCHQCYHCHHCHHCHQCHHSIVYISVSDLPEVY